MYEMAEETNEQVKIYNGVKYVFAVKNPLKS